MCPAASPGHTKQSHKSDTTNNVTITDSSVLVLVTYWRKINQHLQEANFPFHDDRCESRCFSTHFTANSRLRFINCSFDNLLKCAKAAASDRCACSLNPTREIFSGALVLGQVTQTPTTGAVKDVSSLHPPCRSHLLAGLAGLKRSEAGAAGLSL